MDGDWVILTFNGSIFRVFVFPEYISLSVTKYVSESKFTDILGSGVGVSVGDGVFVAVDTSVAIAVGTDVGAGVQEVNKMTIRMTTNNVFFFIVHLFCKELPNGLRY
jgi:hypothetical protein